jgi:hypothetical protein
LILSNFWDRKIQTIGFRRRDLAFDHSGISHILKLDRIKQMNGGLFLSSQFGDAVLQLGSEAGFQRGALSRNLSWTVRYSQDQARIEQNGTLEYLK